MKTLEAQIPQDAASEASLLSCLIARPSIRTELSGNLFWLASHRMIFESVCRLADNHKVKELDFMVVTTDLSSRGQMEEIGGKEYLNEVWAYCPSTDAWQYFKDRLDEVRIHRESVMAAHKILAADTPEDAKEVVSDLVQSKAMVHGSIRHIKDVLQDTLQWLDEKRYGRAKQLVKFGIPQLDDLLWIEPGNMIVISAETGGGKTALAIQAVINSPDTRWAVFSLEMEGEAIGARILSNAGSISMRSLRSGRMSKEEYDSMKRLMDEQGKRAVWLDDRQATIEQIRERCSSLQRAYGLDAVVVDYLQIVSPAIRKEESRQQQVAEISRRLKNMAMELRVAVITMSQLNDEGRLRESRAIGQDADVVMRVSDSEISIQKHRNGAKSDIAVSFVGDFTRFEQA